jgi:integrase
MVKLTREYINALVADGTDRTFPDDTVKGLVLRLTPSGSKLFHAEVRVGGKLKKTPLGALGLAEARRIGRPVLDALRAGRDPTADKVARQQAATAAELKIETFAEQWIEKRRTKLKPRTVADYELLFRQHINPALGHLSVQRISFADVEALHTSMKRIKRRANYSVATLRALLNHAEELGLRARYSNPCTAIEFFRERERERFLSEAEVTTAAEAIAAAERAGVIGVHAAAGLRLALLTGARSGEITAAQWSHVNWTQRLIRLPDSKNNQPRTIHLSDAAIEVLRTLPRIGPFVIAGAVAGEPYKNLSRAWILARAYGGLDDVRLHDLRHSYASLAASQGISLQTIGALLGHKALASTKRYAHLARDQVARASDELGVVIQTAIDNRRARPVDNVVKLKRPRKRPAVRS